MCAKENDNRKGKTMLEIAYRKTKDLVPYDNNPRNNDPAVDAVAESIKEFGFKNPIIIDRNNVIVAGHTRLKAAEQLGMDEVPTICANDLTEEQIRAFRLADNKTAEIAEWDFSALDEELERLKNMDMSRFGFDAEVESMLSLDDEELDEVPEPPKVAKTKRGDIYQLGDHRLMCGDSTSAEDVKTLMRGGKAELLFTSPPYSDMREYEGGKDLSIANLARFIPTYRPYTEYQCVNLGIQRKDNDVYEYWNEYIKVARESGYKMLAWNIWDKELTGNIGQAKAFFPIRHEFIFVFGTDFYEINLTVEKKAESIQKNMAAKTKRNADGTTSLHTTGDTSKRFKQMESVIVLHPVLDNNIRDLHPAQFPVGLPAEYIKAMTNKMETVIEPFGGAGTTLIACEETNRRCCCMELEPKYCDVIVERWENLTGKKAVLLT